MLKEFAGYVAAVIVPNLPAHCSGIWEASDEKESRTLICCIQCKNVGIKESRVSHRGKHPKEAPLTSSLFQGLAQVEQILAAVFP